MDAIYGRTWLDRPARAGMLSDGCGGCLDSPDERCAACGAPTVIALPAGAHALTLCRQCWKLVKLCRAEASAEDWWRDKQRVAAQAAAVKRVAKKKAAKKAAKQAKGAA